MGNHLAGYNSLYSENNPEQKICRPYGADEMMDVVLNRESYTAVEQWGEISASTVKDAIRAEISLSHFCQQVDYSRWSLFLSTLRLSNNHDDYADCHREGKAR